MFSFIEKHRRPAGATIAIGIAAMLMVGSIAAYAAEGVDASSPKATVKSFYAATMRADAAAMRELMLVDNDPEQQLVNAYAELILATKRLADVAKQKYPGASSALAGGTISSEDIAAIDSADITLKGNDLAIVKIAGRPTEHHLRKTGNNWRIVIADASEFKPEERPKQLAMLKDFADTMKKVSDDIAADKFATIQEAENAVQERLSAAKTKVQGDPAASRPTTRP